MRVNAVTLNGDESGAGVRRHNIQLDLIARLVIRLVEFDFEFRPGVEPAGHVRLAGDTVIHARDVRPFRVGQHQREIARTGGVEVPVKTVRADVDRFRLDHPFTRHRLVGELTVAFDQGGNSVLADHAERQAFFRDRIQIRVERDPVQAVLPVVFQVVQVGPGFVTDDGFHRRNQRRGFDRDTAPAAGFESFGAEAGKKPGSAVAAEIKVEHRVAVFIGARFGKRLGDRAPGGSESVEETVIRIIGERESGGGKRQGRLDAAIGGGGAVQVFQIDSNLQVLRRLPAFPARRREIGADFHPVRQKFLDPHARRMQQAAALAVVGDVQVRVVAAHGKIRFRLKPVFLEPGSRQADAFLHNGDTARIDEVQFQRNTLEVLRPVTRFDDHAEVDGVAGPVNATIGKHKGLQTVGGNIASRNGKTRQVQPAVVAVVGHERQVVAFRHGHRHRQPVRAHAGQIGNRGAAFSVSNSAEHRLAVIAENPHFRPANRLPGGDRLDKHLARSLRISFHKEPKIGDQDEALVTRNLRVFTARSKNPDEEQSFLPLFQVGREIEGSELCGLVIFPEEREFLVGDFCDVFLIETVALEIGTGEIAPGLGHQMAQELRQDLRHFKADAVQTTGKHGNFLLPRKRQQAARLHDAQLAWELRNPDDGVVIA